MHDLRNMMSVKKTGRFVFLSLLVLFLFLATGASLSARQDEAVSGNETGPQGQITGIIISGVKTPGQTALDRVLITANRALEYTSIKQHEPVKIIFYFKDTVLGSVQPFYTPESDLIASITTAQAPDRRGGASIEVLLKKDCVYAVNRAGTDVEISFSPSPDEPEAAETAIAPDTELAAEEPSAEDLFEEADAPAAVAAATFAQAPESDRGPAVIQQIDFTCQESGKSAILIGTSHPVAYRIDKVADRTLKLRLFNTRLPEFRRHRPLITTRFASAVDRISPFQAADNKNDTDIVVELRQWVPYRAVPEDSLLTVSFDPSEIGPRPYEAANLPDWQQVLEGTLYTVEQALPEDEALEGSDAFARMLGEKKHYTGEKIALDFYQTNIKNVFKILQQVSGKNYAVDKDVSGEVTISLEKPVPWDQVLDLVLQMNKLGMVEKDEIIRIARRETLQAEEAAQRAKLEAIQARKAQEKQLEPLETEYILINYANAGAEIMPHLTGVLTKERGSITVDVRNNQLIISDTRANIEKCKEIISKIDRVTPQVLIEARIVEVSEDFKREIGTNWGYSTEDVYDSGLNGEYSYNISTNTPFVNVDENNNAAGSIGFNFTRLDAWGTPFVLDATLQVMEEEGSAKIISSPKILTLDNKKALIKQGERFPYQTVEDDDVQIEFEDVDLSLEVTPHVTPDQRIALTIKTTKNEIIGFIETGEPRIATNEAETELLIDDGETIVIGGVVKSNIQLTESGVPVLKDIPIVGWLFKRTYHNNLATELLIFLTPTIVQLEQKELIQVKVD